MPITKIDANGRVLIPIGIRCKLDLNQGDKFAIDHLGEGTIILKKIDLRIPINVIENAKCIFSDIIPDYKPEVVAQVHRTG
jgi:AbrB family looped-hinge helix DNA binding protein